jgi:hypothetical protein
VDFRWEVYFIFAAGPGFEAAEAKSADVKVEELYLPGQVEQESEYFG